MRLGKTCIEKWIPKYDFSINMMRNILGDVGEEQIKLDNKVIKNIAKQLLIQK